MFSSCKNYLSTENLSNYIDRNKKQCNLITQRNSVKSFKHVLVHTLLEFSLDMWTYSVYLAITKKCCHTVINMVVIYLLFCLIYTASPHELEYSWSSLVKSICHPQASCLWINICRSDIIILHKKAYKMISDNSFPLLGKNPHMTLGEVKWYVIFIFKLLQFRISE